MGPPTSRRRQRYAAGCHTRQAAGISAGPTSDALMVNRALPKNVIPAEAGTHGHLETQVCHQSIGDLQMRTDLDRTAPCGAMHGLPPARE